VNGNEKSQGALVDSFGRVAKKLRISITDRCNMQCIYCMPTDNKNDKPVISRQGNSEKWFPLSETLSDEEFVRISRIMARLGIEKIRVTGGEPLLRPSLEKLISSLSRIKGIKSVSMTTNGLSLSEKAKELKESGLQSVNISLDTLKPERYKAMTGMDGLKGVLRSIRVSADLGLKIKINAVIIRGWNDTEVLDLALFARESGHQVRFIEFMPLDGTGIWAPDLVFSKKEMISIISKDIGELVPLTNGNNDNNNSSSPAKIYSFADGRGTVGFIPSMTEPFCTECDRTRLTSDGRFLTCLFENPGHDVKKLLRGDKTDQELSDYLMQCMMRKPEGIISIIKSKTLKPTLNLMHTIGG
jgi:cyclic pyranopterin phosphate synthase